MDYTTGDHEAVFMIFTYKQGYIVSKEERKKGRNTESSSALTKMLAVFLSLDSMSQKRNHSTVAPDVPKSILYFTNLKYFFAYQFKKIWLMIKVQE